MTKQTRENLIGWSAAIVGCWMFCSVTGSAILADHESCHKSFYVERVLFIKMFCEIKE